MPAGRTPAARGGAGSQRGMLQGGAMTALLEIDRISVHIPLKSGFLQPELSVRAVEDVSLTVGRSETLGYVVAGLRKQTAGSIRFNSSRSAALGENPAQIIFQDPFSALDPRMAVG